MLEIVIFQQLGGIPPPSTGFPLNCMFGRRVGQSICMDHMVGSTSKVEIGGTFLVRWRMQGV